MAECENCGHLAGKHLAGRFTIILPGGELVPDPYTLMCIVVPCLCVGDPPHDFGKAAA